MNFLVQFFISEIRKIKSIGLDLAILLRREMTVGMGLTVQFNEFAPFRGRKSAYLKNHIKVIGRNRRRIRRARNLTDEAAIL